MSKTISIGGKNYSWEQLSRPEIRRQVLRAVEAMISEYRRAPARLQAQGWNDLDLRLAIVWTTGQFDGVTESQMGELTKIAVSAFNERITELGGTPLATALTQTPQQQQVVDGRTAWKELAQLMKQPELHVALQKRRTGQTITDARQVALLEHHDALDSANRAQVQLEKSLKVTRPPRASISAPIVEPRFKDADEARSKRLEHQNNLNGDYYDPSSPGYAQARAEVKAAYQLETGEADNK